jgi:hypothetical protein
MIVKQLYKYISYIDKTHLKECYSNIASAIDRFGVAEHKFLLQDLNRLENHNVISDDYLQFDIDDPLYGIDLDGDNKKTILERFIEIKELNISEVISNRIYDTNIYSEINRRLLEKFISVVENNESYNISIDDDRFTSLSEFFFEKSSELKDCLNPLLYKVVFLILIMTL